MGRRLSGRSAAVVLAGLLVAAAPPIGAPSAGAPTDPAPPAVAAPADDWAAVVAALEAGDLDAAHARGRALLAADAAPGGLPLEAQQAAFRLGLALVDADAFERAAEIQTLLFERVPATWSAINAALTLERLGRTDEADGVLARQLAREPRSGDLWNQRGVLWLGAGDPARARRHLGRAVRYGSMNASLSLGRLSLLAGDLEAARAAFRPGVDRPDPHAWGLRGWAATLLPGPQP